MTTIKKTLIAAALLAASGSFAFAQDAGTKVETPAVDATTAAAAGATTETFDTLMSTINADTSAALDLSTITDASKITIVRVSTLSSATGADVAGLDAALTSKASTMTSLHTKVEANAVLKGKLEAEGLTVDDVIAIKMNADGTIIVYVDDRPDTAGTTGMSTETFGTMMSSVNTDNSALDLSKVTDKSKITTVRVSTLSTEAGADVAGLNTALTAKADAMTSLRTKVGENAVLKAMLEADGLAIDDVIAVKSNADGSIVVYVDDRG